jgi:hypothetical protein
MPVMKPFTRLLMSLGVCSTRMHVNRLKTVAFAVAFGLAVFSGSMPARADDLNPFNKVSIDVTPYIWGPTVNGTLRFKLSDYTLPNGQPAGSNLNTFDEGIGPNSYLSKLNSAFMLNAIVHVGAAGLYMDVINVNASNVSGTAKNFTGPIGGALATVALNTNAQIVATLWTIAPSFTVYHSKAAEVSLLAGGQFLNLSANAGAKLSDLMGNSISAAGLKRESYSAFILGTYGHVGLGGKWSAPFYVDAGWGTPSTWQGMIGVKYGNTTLLWRHLQYNAASSTALLQGISLDGPALAYTLHL